MLVCYTKNGHTPQKEEVLYEDIYRQQEPQSFFSITT